MWRGRHPPSMLLRECSANNKLPKNRRCFYHSIQCRNSTDFIALIARTEIVDSYALLCAYHIEFEITPHVDRSNALDNVQSQITHTFNRRMFKSAPNWDVARMKVVAKLNALSSWRCCMAVRYASRARQKQRFCLHLIRVNVARTSCHSLDSTLVWGQMSWSSGKSKHRLNENIDHFFGNLLLFWIFTVITYYLYLDIHKIRAPWH